MSAPATLAKALVAAQAEMPKVPRDGTNPHFKNRYATLDGLLAKVRPVLNKHGLTVAQFPSHADGAPTLVTLLLHESGERLEYEAPLLLTKNDPQGQGSAITYMRRYALAAMLGISDQDDDDGNAARPSQASAPQPRLKGQERTSESAPDAGKGAEEPSDELASPKQVADFWELVAKVAAGDPESRDLKWWKDIANRAAVRAHGEPVSRLSEEKLSSVVREFQGFYAKQNKASAGAAEPGNGSPDPKEAAGAPAEETLFKQPTGPRGSKRKRAA